MRGKRLEEPEQGDGGTRILPLLDRQRTVHDGVNSKRKEEL